MEALVGESPAVGVRFPFFLYYSNVALDDGLRLLILTVAQTQFVFCTALQFRSLASDDVSNTFGFSCRLAPSSGYFVGIKNSSVDLGYQWEICFFFYGSDFDTASAVFAWQMMQSVD